jgi:ABC-type multidrug transport system permease subunit
VSGASLWRSQGRSLGEKGWAPVRYWVMWYVGLGIAVVLFYVLLTPLWIGLRVAAWAAEFQARRR